MGGVDRKSLERWVAIRENRCGVKFIVKSGCGGDTAVPCAVLLTVLRSPSEKFKIYFMVFFF